MQRIIEDWQRRREAVPVVRYEVRGRDVWPKGMYNDPLESSEDPGDNPAADLTGEFERDVTLDFRRNRHRFEWDDCEYSNLERREYRIRCVHVCDGETAFSRIFENSGPELRPGSEKKHVDLLINRGRMLISVMSYKYLPLFLGHGVVTYNDVRVAPGSLLPRLQADDFTYHGRATYGDRECIILRTPEYRTHESEIWVDVERDSAVVQIIEPPERPGSILQVRYQQTGEHWLVAGWAYQFYSPVDGRERMLEEADVVRIQLEPTVADSDFIIEPAPGMYVEDRTSSLDALTGQPAHESSFYRVEDKAGPTELNAYLRPMANVPDGWPVRWRVLAGINVPVLLLLIVLFWRRAKRRGERSPRQ